MQNKEEVYLSHEKKKKKKSFSVTGRRDEV